MCQLLYIWIRMNMIFKSSRLQMFFTVGVLKSLAKKRLQHRCFPVNFTKFIRTPFLQNTTGRLLLEFFLLWTVCLPSELIETRFFLFLNILYTNLEREMNIINFTVSNCKLGNKQRFSQIFIKLTRKHLYRSLFLMKLHARTYNLRV